MDDWQNGPPKMARFKKNQDIGLRSKDNSLIRNLVSYVTKDNSLIQAVPK